MSHQLYAKSGSNFDSVVVYFDAGEECLLHHADLANSVGDSLPRAPHAVCGDTDAMSSTEPGPPTNGLTVGDFGP